MVSRTIHKPKPVWIDDGSGSSDFYYESWAIEQERAERGSKERDWSEKLDSIATNISDEKIKEGLTELKNLKNEISRQAALDEEETN